MGILDGELSDKCEYYDCNEFKSSFLDSSKLSFFHLNINSLSKHFDDLTALMKELNFAFKIIAITETRITTNSIPFNHNFPNYTFISNSTEASAGGTALYVHNSIDIKVRNDLSSAIYKSKLLESTFVELCFEKHSNIVVGSIYKHPTQSNTEFTENYISPLLDKVNREGKLIVLLGDKYQSARQYK